jgi:predicted dehydrogenase
MALAYDVHILSETPIVDMMASSMRIADKVRKAGVTKGVTVSRRFRQGITTLGEVVQSGENGAIAYLVCRFTCECRQYATWGQFRYEIPDLLMAEGAVHHLDLLVDIAAGALGGKCQTLYAQTRQPPLGRSCWRCAGDGDHAGRWWRADLSRGNQDQRCRAHLLGKRVCSC